MNGLSGVFGSIQRCLFPALEEELGELNEKQKEFVRVVELMDLPNYLSFSRAFTQFPFSAIALALNGNEMARIQIAC